jgi:phage shock protein A
MNVWSKLLSALRGGVNEAGEALADSQALRILDQEIRDADQQLRVSKAALAEIMARQKLAAERAQGSAAKVVEYESYALKALDAGNESLALEVAEKIANLERELASEREQAEALALNVGQLRKAVSQTESNIKYLKQQVDTVKATESVQKAQLAVAQRYGGSQSKLHTAVESLERIKLKQAERAAQMEAAAELAAQGNVDDALDAKLRAAGIVADDTSANSVLERLRAQGKA